jgi:hypothetical protein
MPQQGFVRSEGIDVLALGHPSPFPKFEKSRGMTDKLVIKRIDIELDADERQESMRLSVASPADLVEPSRVVPACGFVRVIEREGFEKTSLKPFSFPAEENSGLIKAIAIDQLAEWSASEAPACHHASGEDDDPDDRPHNLMSSLSANVLGDRVMINRTNGREQGRSGLSDEDLPRSWCGSQE